VSSSPAATPTPRRRWSTDARLEAVARIVDGALVDVTVPTSLAELGVVVADLADAAREHADLVERHLGSLTTSTPRAPASDEDRTITRQRRGLDRGRVRHVPAEVELDAPIGVHVHVDVAGCAPAPGARRARPPRPRDASTSSTPRRPTSTRSSTRSSR
jgi:transposase-like protein